MPAAASRTTTAAERHGRHGHPDLPSVTVESYNLEIRDEEGFIGDKASRGAFIDLMEAVRQSLKRVGADPLGRKAGKLAKSDIDALLAKGGADEAALVMSAVEDFAQSLAMVIRRYLRLKSWADVERIVVGGGFRDSRVGELAIARTRIILATAGRPIEIVPIRHHPDEAGLVGGAHLAPKWIFEAFDSFVAVDIGGSNIRTGIVELRQKDAPDLSQARVWKSTLWRHADEETTRDKTVRKLGAMMTELIEAAGDKGLKVAPFVGVGCPGLIADDGSIDRGAQNLPGNWESGRFNLVDRICEMIPEIGGHDTMVLLHNDAVVQGLSEMPFMQDVERWGVLTIGTGLGNASFRNRKKG